jgi:hypothetical protein
MEHSSIHSSQLLPVMSVLNTIKFPDSIQILGIIQLRKAGS